MGNPATCHQRTYMNIKLGYLFLTVGIAFLIASAVLLIMTLYGRLSVPQPFTAEASITMTLSQGGTVNVPLPPHINKAANLSVFFIAMFFLAGIGAKIGLLGAQLVQKAQPPKTDSPK